MWNFNIILERHYMIGNDINDPSNAVNIEIIKQEIHEEDGSGEK